MLGEENATSTHSMRASVCVCTSNVGGDDVGGDGGCGDRKGGSLGGGMNPQRWVRYSGKPRTWP